MINLYKYIFESGGISDDQILYTLGVHQLNSMPAPQGFKIAKKYKISKSNPKPGVIKYMKANHDPIMHDSEEFIHRKDWDLDGLVGQTEAQLMDKSYYIGTNAALKKFKPKHDILTVMQCSSAKPYSRNRVYTSQFVKPYHDYSDFACISNPGIIDFRASGYYPFRYDEWSLPDEDSVNDAVGISDKVDLVNMCRLLRYKEKCGYKHIIAYMPNPDEQILFDRIVKNNIAGGKDWCHIVITKQLRKKIYEKPSNRSLVKNNLMKTRMASQPETYEAYYKILRQCVAESDRKDLGEIWKEKKSHYSSLKESESSQKYQVMDSLSYDDMISKFKNYVKTNKLDSDSGSSQKGQYYKKYYWSALDIMMIGLDGNLVKDIDKNYWDIRDRLDKDKDWDNFGDFLYIYKPFLGKAGINPKDFESEAYKLKLIRPKPSLDLKPKTFHYNGESV